MKKTTSLETPSKPGLDTYLTPQGVPIKVEERAHSGIGATRALEVSAQAAFFKPTGDDDDSAWGHAQDLITGAAAHYRTRPEMIDIVNQALREQEALARAADQRQTEIDEELASYSARPERGLIGRLLHGPNPSPDPRLVTEKRHVDDFVDTFAGGDELKAAAVELHKKYGGVLYDLALRDAESDGTKISRGE